MSSPRDYLYPALCTFCLLLMGAHFLRSGDIWLFLSFLCGSALIWTRQGWGRIVLFTALLGGTLLWTKVGFLLLSMRLVMEENWIRLAVIFGVVILATTSAAYMTFSSAGEKWFSRSTKKAALQSSVFLLSMGALLITQGKVPFPVLMADRFISGSGIFEIFLLSTYGAWLAGKMYSPAGARKARPLLWAGFSFVFFGQLFLGLGGIEQMLMTGKLHLPVPALILGGPLYRGSGFFMPILFLTTIILVGPAWCSHLCYIGAWDDQMSRRAKTRQPLSVATMWKTRTAALALTIITAIGLRYSGLPTFYALTAAVLFGLAGLFIMYSKSRRQGVMVHCSAYCPMGIVANTLGKLSPWRLKIRTDIPAERIQHAAQVCRYSAMTEAAVRTGKPLHACTLCLDCLSACRKGDITLTIAGRFQNRARVIFLTLLISLHVLFLGVARI